VVGKKKKVCCGRAESPRPQYGRGDPRDKLVTEKPLTEKIIERELLQAGEIKMTR